MQHGQVALHSAYRGLTKAVKPLPWRQEVRLGALALQRLDLGGCGALARLALPALEAPAAQPRAGAAAPAPAVRRGPRALVPAAVRGVRAHARQACLARDAGAL